ncbi:type II toxin-antitoxin system prevent-host-death family antitoxin (plasmid) [Sinorhizobium meliloti]|nr:type II toxin-antitoxin system prevent-host-death family antitoxin [Sinorhizobium meliloti]
METVNIHEAKTHLSRLIEKAAQGSPLCIAKAGKADGEGDPDRSAFRSKVQRIGFMAGQFTVPDDFDQMGQ